MVIEVHAKGMAGHIRPMKRKILITGATGFVGGNIAGRLAENPDLEVYALLRDPKKGEALAGKGVRIYEGDITRPETIAEPLFDTDVIIHCAALMSNFDSEPRERFYKVNVEGTENLLRRCDSKRIKQFIHISTSGVYGVSRNNPADEDTPYGKTLSDYEWSKVRSELVVLKYAREKQIPFTVLRPSQLYGPGMYYGWLQTMNAIKSGSMVIPGEGKAKIHLLHIKDLVGAIETVLLNEKSMNRIFNVAGPEVPGVTQVFDLIAEVLGVGRSIHVPYAPVYMLSLLLCMVPLPAKNGKLKLLTPHRVRFFATDHVYDISRIKKDIGYVPRIGIREGFRDMVKWYEQEGLLC